MRFIEFDNILSIRYISKIFNIYLSPKLTQSRIKRQTRTYSEKLPLTLLMINKLRACTCLLNIYITRTWVVMLVSLLSERKLAQKQICVQKHVCVMYDLCTCSINTYMSLNYLIIWLLYHYFGVRVCVWRLMPKKNALVFLILQIKAFILPSL